ncbi:Uncharacterised protein [Klebsiella variicola]|uniref:Uncharacterized protein n=1 Tax=Klebsiella variicola TaxID=244366 RepID=A0A7H4MPW7_KLEVA|nr:Uncharacterised protein [Klebsiella variicola]
MTTETPSAPARVVIGDIKGDFCSWRQGADMQPLAVEELHPVMNVKQADFISRHFVGFHASDHGGIDAVASVAKR